MKYVLKHYNTDNCTYHVDIDIPIEFEGTKDDLALYIIEEYEKKVKDGGNENSINILKYYYFDQYQIEVIEKNIFTLEEWFEKEKIKL
jgi:hypothetical protein